VTNLLQLRTVVASDVLTPGNFHISPLALCDSFTAPPAEYARPEDGKLDGRSERRRLSLADTAVLRVSSTFAAEPVRHDAAGTSTRSEEQIPATEQ